MFRNTQTAEYCTQTEVDETVATSGARESETVKIWDVVSCHKASLEDNPDETGLVQGRAGVNRVAKDPPKVGA